MNIVVITNSYPNKSKPYAGHHVARHIELHREAGLGVRVLTPGESRSGFVFTTLKYLRLGFMVLSTVFQPVDLVHAHWVLPSGLFGMLLAAIRHTPFVVTSHGAFTNTFNKRNIIVRSLVRLVLGHADQIIAVGNEQQARIEAIMGLPVGSVACINMGVAIPETAVSRQAARQQLNLAQDKQMVLFIGNLLHRKGPDLLLKAVSLLSNNSSFMVFIGGQGPEKGALAKQVQDLGLANVVQLIGPILSDDVYTWMVAADICVVPSRTEPFGLAAIEALASGTPVIAAEVGGLMESIQHEHNGLLFPVGDEQALSNCMQQLLADGSMRERMAAVARESVGRFDMRLQADEVLKIYRTL